MLDKESIKMPTHRFIVLTNPVEGREDDFNDWYTGRHIPDVLSVPGIVSAQRFRIVEKEYTGSPYKYLSIYDFDIDCPTDVLDAISSRTKTGAMALSDALDRSDIYAVAYEPITPLIQAG
jgi:hypothetical protein